MADLYWFCASEQYQPEELLEHAREAETAGFDGIMMSEHFHPWVDDVGTGGFAFGTLAAIAATTNHLKLMSAVTAPLFRMHPGVVAQAAATIDRLSHGRFTLGVGMGESINESPLGYELPPYKERKRMLAEAYDIMRRLLDGETVTESGDYFTTKSAKLYSPPVHRVPIMLAAGGPQTAATAGSYDGVIVSVKDPADALHRVVEPARATASNPDGFQVAALRWSIRGTTDAEIWEAVRPQRGLRAPSRDTATDPAQLAKEADSLPKDAITSRFSRVESAADYVAVYGPLITELGATMVGIQTASLSPIETIRMLGAQVLPELRKL